MTSSRNSSGGIGVLLGSCLVSDFRALLGDASVGP